MNAGLLAFVACIYVGVAYTYLRDGNSGMALAFVAYALSNVGFIIAGSQ